MMLEEVSCCCCCCYTAESAYTLSKDDDHYILRCDANSRGLLRTHKSAGAMLVQLPFQPPEQKVESLQNDLVMHRKL